MCLDDWGLKKPWAASEKLPFLGSVRSDILTTIRIRSQLRMRQKKVHYDRLLVQLVKTHLHFHLKILQQCRLTTTINKICKSAFSSKKKTNCNLLFQYLQQLYNGMQCGNSGVQCEDNL